MDNLGHIQAANTEDPDSLESVRFGVIEGDGLLDALSAASTVALFLEDDGWAVRR